MVKGRSRLRVMVVAPLRMVIEEYNVVWLPSLQSGGSRSDERLLPAPAGENVMRSFMSILVATDTRLDDQSIVDSAAGWAKSSGASLKLVDVVPLFPWTARLLLSNHEELTDLMIREKQEKLEKLAVPLRDQGIEVATSVMHGKTSVEIIREVLRNKHDLVMRVAKGADSSRNGFFGTTGARLLRECPCAVYLVAPNSPPAVKHVMACVDTSTGYQADTELNETVYKLAASISQKDQTRLSIVHAWSIDAERLLEGRMPGGEFEQMKRSRQEHIKGLLGKFLSGYNIDVDDDCVHMLKGDAHRVIPEFAVHEGIDLIVMGTVGRSGAAGMLIGNTAEQILSAIECSVVAVKPSGFVSPIKMGEYVESTCES